MPQRPFAVKPITLLLIVIVAFSLLCIYFSYGSWLAFTNFALDDAWIHQVYAHSFAFGYGFAYNTPGPQETGFTSPLWVILCAPLQWLSNLSIAASVIAIKCLGYVLGTISLILLWAISRQLQHPAWLSAIITAMFMCSSVFLYSLFSGMENALLACLWLGVVWAVVTERLTFAAILVGLCAITRPEAVLLVVVFIGYMVMYHTKAQSLRHYSLLLYTILPFALWVGYCLLASGYPLPNTFYLKMHTGSNVLWHNIPILWRVIHASDYFHSILFCGISIVGLVYCCISKQPTQRSIAIMLAFAAIVYLLAVITTRPITEFGYFSRRYLNPAIIMLLGFTLIMLAELYQYHRYFGGTLLILLLLSSSSYQYHLVTLQKHKLMLSELAIHAVNVKTGIWLREHTPTNTVIGVNDAGAIRYMSHRRIIDLMGLNSMAIAHQEPQRLTMFEKMTWLAIFPSWQTQLTQRMHYPLKLEQYDRQTAIGVPSPSFYSICSSLNSLVSLCPDQYQTVVYRRK